MCKSCCLIFAASSKSFFSAAKSSLVDASSTSFLSSLIAGAIDSFSITWRDEASSIRSIALSGRYRSVIYRDDRCTAASIASSVMDIP